MLDLSPASNKKFPREQEGFNRSIGIPKGDIPKCATYLLLHNIRLHDFRGDAGYYPAEPYKNYTEWETSPAESEETTVFTWIAGSQVRPVKPAYPYVKAILYVNGNEAIRFPLGFSYGYELKENGFVLKFEPRRFASLAEDFHRVWQPEGISGFYRLEVPGKYLEEGRPLLLKVEIEPVENNGGEYEAFYYVSPRNDVLSVSLSVLRDEISQLQEDMITLKRSHELLYTQVYPQLFPKKINGVYNIICQDETKSYIVPNVTVLSDGEIVVTVREGIDHAGLDGTIVMFRSYDNGVTWSEKEYLYEPGLDHRNSCIFELQNGEWLANDYRITDGYDKDGLLTIHRQKTIGPTLWGAWSKDKGRTWSFSEKPLFVPEMTFNRCSEAERHMLQLPDGRLLMAAAYAMQGIAGCALVIYYSDDNGRVWDVLSRLPHHFCECEEPAILRTKSGKLILLSRSEIYASDMMSKGCLFQSESYDGGKTWSELFPTDMSSMSAPGHLLQLADGRILCTHASRAHPGSVYITVSYDEGKTWDTKNTRIIANDITNYDACYPTSGQMSDGKIITVWYNNKFGKFYISSLIYKPEDI